MQSGVPIDSEAGVGYRLRYRLDVPPLLFDVPEIEVLLVGSRMVQAWADNDLGQAATTAQADDRPAHLCELRPTVCAKRVVRIAHRRDDGTLPERTLWPLGIV